MGIPPPIELANLSMADSLILMVMALVVFGPRRLPQIGRQIGKLMYEFRKASNDFKFQMEEELRVAEEADRRKKEEEERQRAAALAPPVIPGPPEPVSLPAPSIEAQADIGAIESPSVSPYSGEEIYPPQTPVQASAQSQIEPEQAIAESAHAGVPTIMPPSTGEIVARPSPPSRHYTPTESNGSDHHAASTEEAVATPPPSDPPTSPTEPVRQHG